MHLSTDGRSTIIYGGNGAGKSSILDAVNYLYWGWLNRLNPAQGNDFKSLTPELIRLGETELKLASEIQLENRVFSLTKTYPRQAKADKERTSEFAHEFAQLYIMDDADIPVFAYYSANRSNLNASLKSLNPLDSNFFSKWSSLSHTVASAQDFRDFFEWFRNQEDYEFETIKDTMDLAYQDVA